MSSNNAPVKTKKYLAWATFWLSPVAIILVLSQLFAGTPAQADDSIRWNGRDSARPANNGGSLPAATPAAPVSFAGRPTGSNPVSANTPTPTSVQLHLSADTPGQYFIFLPILFKTEVPYLPPYNSLASLFGPILDPGPAISSQSSDEITIQFGPTLDPPPPVTPTSDVPTVIPGSPTFTPTPKVTLTPTATPTSTPALIPGGDFDSDTARIRWREYSLKSYPLFFDDKDSDPPSIYGGAYSPNWAVWLGGDDNEISYIEGQVTVPTSRNYVGHVIKLQSYDSLCASSKYDDLTLAGHLRYASASTLNVFGVDIGGMLICENFPGRFGCGSGNAVRVLVTGYDLCNLPDASGWGIFVVPLVGPGFDFRGKTVTLQIKAITDAQLSSSVFVDDVVWLDGIPTGSISGLNIQTAGPQPLTPVLMSDPALFEAAGLPIPPEKATLTTAADTGFAFSKSR